MRPRHEGLLRSSCSIACHQSVGRRMGWRRHCFSLAFRVCSGCTATWHVSNRPSAVYSTHYPGLAFLVANLYGYAAGPTFPDALARTDELLRPATEEVVFGRSGPRMICGDLHYDAVDLTQIELWKERGWIDAQSLGQQLCGLMPRPTRKGVTTRDYIFLSPEAAALDSTVLVELSTSAASYSPGRLLQFRQPLPLRPVRPTGFGSLRASMRAQPTRFCRITRPGPSFFSVWAR